MSVRPLAIPCFGYSVQLLKEGEFSVLLKKPLRIVYAGLAAALIAGCGSTTSSATAKQATSATLKIAMANDVSGFDPDTTASASTFEVAYNIYNTLITVTSRGQLKADLATHWSSSSDGKVWTVKLRPHVKFQNGKAFTAQDVVYTFDRILNKRTADPNIADFSEIASVKALNPLTVQFTLSKAYSPFLASLALPWAAITESGTGHQLKTHPIGTGPYELEKWVPQQQIVLKKFPGSFQASEAKFSTVTFNIVPSESTQLLDLQSAQDNIVTALNPSSASDVKSDTKLKLVAVPQDEVQILALNNTRAPFNNVLVRQAISYAINRPAIIQAVDFGYGQADVGPIPTVGLDYANLTSMYPHSMSKARSLLAKAGYSQGFSATLALPQPYQFHIQTGELIAQELAPLGIHLTTTVVPWSEWLSNIYEGHQYDMTVISFTGRLDPAQMLSRYAAGNPANMFGYSDPAVTADLAQATVMPNGPSRVAMYHTLQKLIAKTEPAVFIQSPDAVIGMSSKVHGWHSYPIDVYNLRNVSLGG